MEPRRTVDALNRGVEAQNMELWRVCRPVVADSQHFFFSVPWSASWRHMFWVQMSSQVDTSSHHSINHEPLSRITHPWVTEDRLKSMHFQTFSGYSKSQIAAFRDYHLFMLKIATSLISYVPSPRSVMRVGMSAPLSVTTLAVTGSPPNSW